MRRTSGFNPYARFAVQYKYISVSTDAPAVARTRTPGGNARVSDAVFDKLFFDSTVFLCRFSYRLFILPTDIPMNARNSSETVHHIFLFQLTFSRPLFA